MNYCILIIYVILSDLSRFSHTRDNDRIVSMPHPLLKNIPTTPGPASPECRYYVRHLQKPGGIISDFVKLLISDKDDPIVISFHYSKSVRVRVRVRD
jgi:hypothetical protein